MKTIKVMTLGVHASDVGEGVFRSRNFLVK